MRINSTNDKKFFHNVVVRLLATRLLNKYIETRSHCCKNMEAEWFAEFWTKNNIREIELREEVADKFIELLNKRR